MTALSSRDHLHRPSYPAAEAGRLVGLTATRVRRWLTGYSYTYGESVRHQQPVVRRKESGLTSYASFLDLVDLLFVKRFLDSGISLQKVRRALGEAREILGTDHFARETFFTDGNAIFLQVQEKGEAILELISGGQWTIASIIQQLAEQIEFEAPGGLACRWHPLGRGMPVVLDPFVSFGAPSIVGRGVTTANIHDLFVAENESLSAVRAWWDLTGAEVEAAVEFELQLVA